MLDLSNLPLTESILQSCFKSKTYVRDGNWDILWYLGGKNDVTIGEKDGKFYLIPNDCVETVVEVLPFEFVQGQHVSNKGEAEPIYTLSELERIYPELTEKLRIGRIQI